MIGILEAGDEVVLDGSRATCHIERMLGAGGQGEVYQATMDGRAVAVKWYYAHQATDAQRAVLGELIGSGPPDARFLWPEALVTAPLTAGFGYVMALREPRFAGISDLLVRRVSPSFSVLATVGAHLAQGFHQLHAKGLCYRDISNGNVFFDPDNGDVLICDNDNVSPRDTSVGVIGTPRFMAPELVRGEAMPSTETDLYSLAVLLFLLLVNHHPLDGRREADIACFDLAAMNLLYGVDPRFIFDPTDRSNEPVPGYHDNAIAFWPIYPTFLRELFVAAFTTGLQSPGARVREFTWRGALSKLRDSIYYCSCGAQNVYDGDALLASGGVPGTCWSCQQRLRLPLRIRIGPSVIMLNHNSKLFQHHLLERSNTSFEVGQPCAEVIQHPTTPGLWGLRNLTDQQWMATNTDGSMLGVDRGRSVSLVSGMRIRFGMAEGEVRV